MDQVSKKSNRSSCVINGTLVALDSAAAMGTAGHPNSDGAGLQLGDSDELYSQSGQEKTSHTSASVAAHSCSESNNDDSASILHEIDELAELAYNTESMDAKHVPINRDELSRDYVDANDPSERRSVVSVDSRRSREIFSLHDQAF